jgi:hypothetical protein
MHTYAGSLILKLAAALLLAAGTAATAGAQLPEPPDVDVGRMLDLGPAPVAAAPTAEAPPGGEISLEAEAPEEELAPWRGSEIIYTNEVSIAGLDRSAELTWNPYWAMTWIFKPRWWFDEIFYVGARLDLSREITEADDRTLAGETWVHDLLLSAAARRFVTIPEAEIDVSADLVLTLPTSKISRSRTLNLGLGPGLRVDRTFELIGDLSIGYHVRFTSFLHRYTTAELETPLIPGCARSESGCEEFLNTGERNVRWRVQHGIDLSWDPLEWFGVSAGFEHFVDWLYAFQGEDPSLSAGTNEDTDRRYRSAFSAEATFTPWAPIQIGIGYSTISPQLAPDSTYYNPFYNRYSTLYLDLRLEVDGLVEQIAGGPEA